MSEFIQGDCMEHLKKFPDGYFELAIVDPPYGGVTQGGYATNKISGGVARNRNDYHLALWAQEAPGKEYFDELRRVSKNQIIWGGNYFAHLLPPSQCWVVWDKEKPDGVGYADCELAWTSFDKAARLFHFAWNGMIQGDMKNKEHKIHPTQKPVALYKWLLRNFSSETEHGIILDTHVGSGSSLIACHDMGHEYIGFEIDPVYYANAKVRINDHTRQISIFDLNILH